MNGKKKYVQTPLPRTNQRALEMEITITLRDTTVGQVEIEETRLPYSGEKADSVTTASVLADELRKCVDMLGDIEKKACGTPVSGMDSGEWEDV